ncbi:MAG: hypothetical protein AB7Y46_02800 [Armatimonadota bacterium]
MMATPHLLTGAAVARVLRRPVLALPAAFASHFVLDMMPHLDSNDLFGMPGHGPTQLEASVAVADFIFGSAVVVALCARRRWGRIALLGAFFGMLIDLVDNMPPWGEWFSAWPGTAWLSQVHHGIQPELDPSQLVLGFGTQLAVIAIGVAVLRRRERLPRRVGRTVLRRGRPQAGRAQAPERPDTALPQEPPVIKETGLGPGTEVGAPRKIVYRQVRRPRPGETSRRPHSGA